MSHRLERIARIVRDVVSDAVATRLSDPRISRLTSVTRVEISADCVYADVFVSVLGADPDTRKTVRGLESARGVVQSMVARRLDLRRCPILRFRIDSGIKKGIEIIAELDRLAEERERRTAAADEGHTEHPPQ